MFFVQFYEPCAGKVRVKNVENYSLLSFCSLDKHLLPQIYRQLVHLKSARFTPARIFIKIQSIFHNQRNGALTHILCYFRAIPTVKLDSLKNFYESLRKPKMTTQKSNQGQGYAFSFMRLLRECLESGEKFAGAVALRKTFPEIFRVFVENYSWASKLALLIIEALI